MTKKPLTIDERLASLRREILMCSGYRDIPEIVPSWNIINVAALLILIARQERDEALAIGEMLCRMHGGSNDNIV